MNCIICDSNDLHEEWGRIADFIAYRIGVNPNETITIQCRSCGFRYSQLRFTDQQAQAIYGDYRTDRYFNERESFEPGFKANYLHHFQPRNFTNQVEQFVLPHINPANVLDIGGGNGENTPFADRATITDIGETPTGRYDLVILSHVLEHVADPRTFVATARQHLNPDGYLYTETPIDPAVNVWHEHCQIFSENSLRHLLNPIIAYQEADNGLGMVRMTLTPANQGNQP